MNRFHLSWDKGVVVFLVITVVLGMFSDEKFLATSNMTFILRDIAEIAIIAVAMTYLIIAGEIDLSVASILSLSSATIGFLYRSGVSFEVSIIGGILAGLLAGLINGVLVTIAGLPSLAVTIATMALFRGMCWILLGNKPVNQLPEEWTNIGYSQIPGTFIPWTMIAVVIIGAIMWFILHGTKFGRWVFAIGISSEAANFSGVPVRRVKLGLFAMTGLLSGIAGVIYTIRFASSSPDGAVGYELAVIAAVLFGGVSIAGGLGTIWGVLSAVLSLGVMRSALKFIGFSANALLVVSGTLLLVSVIAPAVTENVRNRSSKVSTSNTKQTKEGVPQ